MSGCPTWTIDQINQMDLTTFRSQFGTVFEKSPWVAEVAFTRRPFLNPSHLLDQMKQAVEEAGEQALLELLRAHPDLAARLQDRADLSPESWHEQTQAGLLTLPQTQAAEMRQLLQAYRNRFDFPFIICVRKHDPGAILASLRHRLGRDKPAELQEAWAQVQLIAELRLRDRCVPA